MLMVVKEVVKKVLLGKRYDSNSYIKYLRSTGCEIGNDTIIYDPSKTHVDTTRPWLITIGNHVRIAGGVTILTHGYDWSVLKGVYGDILGSAGRVVIGDNVFIGTQTTILKSVHIGNNVIIGANSLVNKDIPDNCVAAGNPCKVIMNLEDYHEKRKAAQIKEAKELVVLYRERYGKDPDEQALHEFFWLFTNGDDELPGCWNNMMHLGGNYDFSKQIHKKSRKQFENLTDFLNRI